MTNQQKPEALRPEMLDDLIETFATAGLGRYNLMRVELPRHQWAQLAVALSRLHTENERLAALVEAQQPVQSAAAEVENLRKALQFYADKDHFNIADEGAWDTVSGEPQNYWCDEEGTATVEDGTIARLALAGHQLKFDADAAPQPSPTPQADSQPAPDDFQPCASCFGTGVEGDADDYGRTIDVTCGECNGSGRAARAPADSVTAPAGGVVGYRVSDPHEPDLGHWLSEEPGAAWCVSEPLTLAAAPTPPAQTADSVLEDAARLERERICAAIKAEDDYCVDHGDYMLDSDDCIKIVRGEWVRPDFAIDAAMKAGGAT